MRALVRDLLTLSHASQFDMTWTRFALDACVDTALQSLRLRVEETGATIERQPLPEIMGDATLLTQLYQNLLSNALKYQANGPPVIRLTAEPRGDVWLLGVQDNGIGIDPAYAEYIFTPFKRLHSRVEYAGTGMGLAICRKVVERHGGRIWVESRPGQGATFSFTLPRKNHPAAAERTVPPDKRST
jgi:light-regulated signal transduction histidine kinase (bacteriophytochrome)